MLKINFFPSSSQGLPECQTPIALLFLASASNFTLGHNQSLTTPPPRQWAAQETGTTHTVALCFLVSSAALCLLLVFLSCTLLLQVFLTPFSLVSLFQSGSPVGHGPSGVSLPWHRSRSLRSVRTSFGMKGRPQTACPSPHGCQFLSQTRLVRVPSASLPA